MSDNTVETIAEAPAKVAPKRKDFTNLRHRPFLIVNTIQRPVKASITRKAGWADADANWSIFENPYVVDAVKPKQLIEATVIIDIMRSTVLKSRFTEVSEEEVLHHYLDKYKEQVKEAIDLWMTKMARRMQADSTFGRARETVQKAMGTEKGADAYKVVADQPVGEVTLAPAGFPAAGTEG